MLENWEFKAWLIHVPNDIVPNSNCWKLVFLL